MSEWMQNLLEGQVQSLCRNILLVEDNPGDAEYIIERMTKHARLSNEIVHVSTLSAALETLDAREFDAVLLDLRLPDGVGIECVRTVCKRAGRIPVVVLTGVDDGSLPFSCIAEGAQDYIQKEEIRTQDLNRVVSYAIARAGEIAQRRSADALRQRLAQIVEVARDAIVNGSVDGSVTSSNKGAEETFGYAPREAIGQPLGSLSRTPMERHEDAHEARFEPPGAHAKDGRAIESCSREKEGPSVEISAIATELLDTAGRISCLAAVCRDIFERQSRDSELRRRNSELLMREERMRSLASHLTDAMEKERTRIARELHDGVGQQLSAVKWDLQGIADAMVPRAKSKCVGEKLARAQAQIDQLLETVRKIAIELRPSVLDVLGLPEAIRDEARRFSDLTGCRVNVDVRTDLRPSERTATAIFRIVQELLTNVGRYAHASFVQVDVSSEDRELKIQVADDGIGIDPEAAHASSSLGLRGIQERARLVDASFSIERRREGGTLAIVQVRC